MGNIPAGGDEPPADTGTNDRREALRRSVVDSHLITVDLAFQSGALLLDLSETGMGVQALSSAPTGTITPVHFELPETGGRVEGVGRIAWTDRSGRLGIRFEDVAELSRLNLAQWLSRDRRPLVAPGANIPLPTWPPPHMRDETAALRRDLTIEKLEGEAALTYIVERMRNVTRATGAVIALEQDGMIVCCASSGNAPGVGARVDPNSGLSGECIRNGEIVRCEDTETDPRADRLVCRRLELRSMVIVPVRLQGRPSGLLEVFASRPHAFHSSDVLLLRRVADVVAGIALRDSQPSSAPPSPQTLMSAALLDPFLAEPQAEAAMSPTMDEFLSLNIEEIAAWPEVPQEKPLPDATPAVNPARGADVAGAPPAPRFEQSSARAAVEPLASVEVMASSLPLGLPETGVPLAFMAPRPVSVPDFATPLAMGSAAAVAVRAPSQPHPAPEKIRIIPMPERLSERDAGLASVLAKRLSPWNVRIGGAGILLAVLLVGGWQVWRATATPKATPVDSESSRAAAPQGLTSSAPLAVTSTINVPVVLPPARPTGVATRAALPSIPAKSAPAKNVPEEISAPITLPPPDLTKSAADAPPSVAMATRSEPPAISNVLRAPVAAPKLEPPPVSQLTGGKLLQRYNPVYPSSAAGKTGEVVLKASINREGKVTAVKVISGQQLLAQAAALAVKRWRYQPFLLNGVPIEVESTVTVKFTAPGR